MIEEITIGSAEGTGKLYVRAEARSAELEIVREIPGEQVGDKESQAISIEIDPRDLIDAVSLLATSQNDSYIDRLREKGKLAKSGKGGLDGLFDQVFGPEAKDATAPRS